MTIRKKLRAAAELQIQDMIEKLEQRAIEVCGDTAIDPKELCRLVSNPSHSKSLMEKLKTKIADQAENEIIKQLGVGESPMEEF